MLKVLKKIPYRMYMVLTKPERFFKKMVLDGRLEESMIKAFLFGLLGCIAIFAINLISGATFTFSGVMLRLFAYPLIAVAVLFIFSGLVMLFSEVTGGHREWEVAVKGTSSIFFMYPFILILDELAFNCLSLWIVNLLVDGYVLFLLYNIAVHCMGGKKKAVLSVIGIMVVFLLSIYTSDYRIGWLSLKNPMTAIECIA